jgi:hypothetical protein
MEKPRAAAGPTAIKFMHSLSRISAPTGCSIAARFPIAKLKLARRGHLCSGGLMAKLDTNTWLSYRDEDEAARPQAA